MTTDPQGDSFVLPTSADASRILQEITPVARRSRRLARDVTFARPLLAWGLAWISGAVLYQFIPGAPGAVLGTAASVGASAACWLVRPREVQLGSERQFALLWIVLFVTSPLLVAVAAPANAHLLVVFLASLWALGMLMYGVGVGDLPVAGVGLATMVAAAVARQLVPGWAVLAVGICGGLGMVALGAWRMRWKR
jgi:hypothetical protein